ncbi:MAG: DUF4097 family beta strand repeat-containing protein [Terriglobales bacterium]
MASAPPPVVPVPVPVRRRSLSGPLILIIIGVFFLLRTSHLVDAVVLRHWFAHWWPLLLIFWGVIRLFEYYSDQRHGYPPRHMGGGGIFLLIMFVIFGLGLTSFDREWPHIRENIQMDGDNPFDEWFGGQTYTFNNSQQQDLPANATLRALSDHGDVTVNSWDENKIKVDVTKKIRTEEGADTNKLNTETQPTISVEGNTVTVNANTAGAGGNVSVQSDLQIWVPRTIAVDVATRKGDVTVRDREANVKASNSKGALTVEDVKGNVALEQHSKGDIHVARIKGDVTVNGQVDDSSISDVSGDVTLTGDYYGDMQLSKLAKGFSFRSSRTDLQMAKLDGDLNMNPGDLRANNIAGPVRVLTKSTDIHFDELNGELKVENSNGNIEVHSSKLGPMDITNKNGDIHLVVPEKTAFQADLRTKNGDVNSDFNNLKVETQNGESRASGTVGGGGPTVKVNSEHGNIDIRKAGSEG